MDKSMTIKTTQKVLLEALGKAGKAVPSKAIQPIMECFHISVADGVMTTVATDGNITLFSYANVEGEGSACIQARMLLDIVKTLPSGDVTLTATAVSARIEWAKGHAEIPVFPVADFPEIATAPEELSAVVDYAELDSALRHCLPHVSDDEIRPALTGVYFNGKDGKIDAVASDSHTLMLRPINAELTGDPFILHQKAASILLGSLGEEGKAEIRQDDNAIYFRLEGDIDLRVRKIVGKFPDYTRILRATSANVASVDKKEFMAVINRVSVCAEKASQTIKLTCNSLDVRVEAQDLGFNARAEDSVEPDSYDGGDITIGFKADLLLKTVAGFEGDKVVLNLEASNKACIVTSEEDNATAVIMPVMIQ
jgi:DNA polymerase-3 subunit beta